MKFVSFDLSSHTGWSIFNDSKLEAFGVFHIKIKNYKSDIRAYTDLPKDYPHNFIEAANDVVAECRKIVDKYKPDFIVTEHTCSSKFRLSQRFLEWVHLKFFEEFEEIRIYYLLNSDWRKATNCYLKFWPEHQKWNKQVAKAKKKAVRNKAGAKVAKINGKIVSKIDQKKLSIIIANEIFKLNTKDDNIADSLLLGKAAVDLNLFS